MQLKQLKREFAVCKLASTEEVNVNKEFTFLSVTEDEISLVCEARDMPQNTIAVETGWKGLKICGVLDFGMVGVIAKIAGLLADQDISIFVVSTYNTDYIFLKSGQYGEAVTVLECNGYSIV